MSALSSALTIDMNCIAARTPHQLARLERHWTRASVNRQHESWRRRDSWKPSEDRISNQRIFLTQGLRMSEVSAKLRLCQLATLRRTHSSLIWPFAKMATLERMVLSQWSLLDTCMCDLCLVLAITVIDIWTGLLNQCPINWHVWKDIELGQMFILSALQNLFNPWHILARNWNRQRNSW